MRMKKTYLQPKMVVHSLCTTSSLLTVSGNFSEGETMTVGVNSNVEVGGSAALTKGNYVDWEDWE